MHHRCNFSFIVIELRNLTFKLDDSDVFRQLNLLITDLLVLPSLFRIALNDLFLSEQKKLFNLSLNFIMAAFSVGALVFSVTSGTPVLGKLIRTSCGIDEVCLSDIIPEAAEIYPNKQLEIILRITKPPKSVISTGLAILRASKISLY